MLVKILMLVIVTEALVELICKAEILEHPRCWLKSRYWFFKELLDCPYCTSVWMGMFMALTLLSDNTYLLIGIYGISLHRLSNFLHLVFSWIRNLQFNVVLNRKNLGDDSVS